ncbi:MAG: hypothetical protein D6732_21725 [Methanobacteriota archaeon]|nr:MAG: hypothetical protein D6732_21725 [Euryarchaeota archaeon]
MDVPTISGNYRGFAFFRSGEHTPLVEKALAFWQRFAKQHDQAERIGKRLLGSITTTERDEIVREMEQYYAPPPPRNLERINFEYLRTCFGQGQLTWRRVHPKVIQLEVIFDTRLSLSVNPFFRFFKQFKGFCGILDEFWMHYNANGTIGSGINAVPPGVREMESTAIEWMESIDYNDTVLEDVFLLLLDRYTKTRAFKRKETFFERVVGGIYLSKEIRRRALKQITKLDQLILLRHRHPDMQEEIDRQIRSLEEFIASTESHREHMLTRLDLLDRATVESTIRERYTHLEEKLIRKLAKMIIRVRKNTFSSRAKAPEGHVGVVCTSVLDGNRYIIRVLPGQPPFRELLVRCDKEIRFIHPIGSLFVVWLPRVVTGDEKYYRSYNNVALHIEFPTLLVEPEGERDEEDEEEVIEEYQISQ